ncbi:hypothetical protein [Couchioplanes caeruleus]|uniref:Uncharacterized protein n=2 Tax=Couchioplanes caeruleus TaxID=56438 RepID=A0A1K0GNV1_9ACTN|nr:hypothetical protein [Couchioplanes caeruleus]OJF12772.1 hypothetical protein BG844_18765 [Couchioplanes caeruleus subsp. caeruleus]ROP29417.1 hypothetical protein EDD30_2210 [Couchioplanes caeruleus]
MHRITIYFAALAAVIGGVVLPEASAAHAANTRQMCSSWTESTIVANTPTWGRIGQRMCVQWKAGGSEVRRRIEARFDWPMGDCTVSVPPPNVSCPANRIHKLKKVDLDELRMNLHYAGPSQRIQEVHCDKGRRSYQPFTQLGGAVTTICSTAWQSQSAGTYWVRGNLTFRRGATVTSLPSAGSE